MSNDALISCRQIWKIYGDDPARFFAANGGAPSAAALSRSGYVAAVNDVSLDVRRGEILVVMGLSGSGKSTLVRCLSRLIDCTAGDVRIDGQDLRAMSPRELIELRRHKMGMVFQHFALLPHRTVLENVAFPLHMQRVGRRRRIERARQMIELVGLHGREDRYPRQLSGGQQQRVGIARSLVVEPDIWLLDEPFSALDPLIRREMQDEFLRLQQSLQKTIVFITHDFDEALRLADRIAIMYGGRVVQLDTPEHIVLNPASDYVRNFTREVPRERVVTVASLMDAGGAADAADHDDAVPAEATIQQIAGRVFRAAHDRPFAVRDAAGALVGVLRRQAVLDCLYADRAADRDARPATADG